MSKIIKSNFIFDYETILEDILIKYNMEYINVYYIGEYNNIRVKLERSDEYKKRKMVCKEFEPMKSKDLLIEILKLVINHKEIEVDYSCEFKKEN